MILTITNKWANETVCISKTVCDAKRGRYLLNSIRKATNFATKTIENGFLYETPRQYCGNSGKCTTIVTLKRNKNN